MQVQSEADRFKSQETRAMAKRLANLLQWHFRRQGDQGAALGVFSIVGRGDGSIHDSYRQAEPGDNLQDYHLPLNALQPEDGPFYVWTRANRYERRGLLLPDITGDEQPGSNRAIYERRDLAGLTAELLLRVAFQLGHRPGLLLPQNGKRPEIVRPDSSEGSLLSRLRLAQEQTTQTRFEDCLDSLLAMSSNIEFAVVISDLLSCNWEERLSKLARRLELVVFQIVDPWDLYLPDLGQVRVIQEGQRVRVNTSDSRVRNAYRQQSKRQQKHIAETLQAARIRHYRLDTDKLLLEQLVEILESDPSIRTAV